MNDKLKRDGWNPYLAGALAGMLAVMSVFVSTRLLDSPKYLGASTSFVRAGGYLQKLVSADSAEANAYLEKTGIKVDWQMLFVIGILLGALVSSLTDRSFRRESVPPIWRERFGDKIAPRAVGAVLGGIVAMFGARLAGGCPSGHGLSGLMQLSVSGYIAMAGFFGIGILVAHCVYRKGGAQ